MTLSTGDNKVYFVDLFMHKKGKYCSRLNNLRIPIYIFTICNEQNDFNVYKTVT